MLKRYKSALSPPLSVQLTVTFTAPLTSSEKSTQERVEIMGGPERQVVRLNVSTEARLVYSSFPSVSDPDGQQKMTHTLQYILRVKLFHANVNERV